MTRRLTPKACHRLFLTAFAVSGAATAQPVDGQDTANQHQEATAVPSIAPQTRPEDEADVVELKAGGFYRGVITEQQPGSHVTIRLPSGIVRTVPADEVQFAGLFANRPGASTATPAPATPTTANGATANGATASPSAAIQWLGAGNGVLLRLRSQVPDATVWAARVGSNGRDPDNDGWVRICTTPCDAKFAKGMYRFSIAPPDDDRVDVDDPIEVNRPTTYMAILESHTTQRALGWVTFGLGIFGGLCSIAAIKSSDGKLIGGTLGFGAGLAAIGFAVRKDGAFMTSAESDGVTNAQRSSAPGFTLSGAF